MNIPNLKKLVAHLTKQRNSRQAARFNMSFWGDPFIMGMQGALQKPICGTQACLAGETVLAFKKATIDPKNGGLIFPSSPCSGGYLAELLAQEILDLDREQKNRLFKFKSWRSESEDCGWPANFETAYGEAETPKKRLDVAIARVKHFIATNGAE